MRLQGEETRLNRLLMLGTRVHRFLKPSYPLLVALYCVYSASMVSVGPLTDSLVLGKSFFALFAQRPLNLRLGMLGPDADSYGRQRVFGTLACGLTTFLTALLVSRTGMLYLPFAIRAVGMSALVAVLAKVPNYWQRKAEQDPFALKEPPKTVLQHRPSLASTESSFFSVLELAAVSQPSSPVKPSGSASQFSELGDLRKSMLKRGIEGRPSEHIIKTASITSPIAHIDSVSPSPKPNRLDGWGWLFNVNVLTFLFSVGIHVVK